MPSPDEPNVSTGSGVRADKNIPSMPGRPAWSNPGEAPLKVERHLDQLVPFCQKRNPQYPFFTVGDANSLLLLFFDILGTLINLVGAAAFDIPGIVGLDAAYSAAFRKMVFGKVCPGIAFSIVSGNLYYGWMAHRVAGFLNRSDITALPYGLTTSGGIAVVFGVMLPSAFTVKFDNFDGSNITIPPEDYATAVWKRGVAANFVCGIMEAGFSAGIHYPGQFLLWIVRNGVSKAALFSPICGVGFCWLSLDRFITGNFHATIFFIPFALVFTAFYAEDGCGIYGKIPMSLVMVIVGTCLRWFGADREKYDFPDWDTLTASVGELDSFFGTGLGGLEFVGDVLPIVVPVALAIAVETLNNVQMAADVGDPFHLGEAMIVDGCGTIAGALCGSVFPTTVYMGHMRHKANGATGGYSITNGLVYFILLMAGLQEMINLIIDPVSAGLILMCVGLMVVQHCIESSVPRHYPAICIGIFVILCDFMRVKTLGWRPDMKKFGEQGFNDFRFKTAISNVGANSGILLAMLLTQVVCDLIDNYFSRAACFSALMVVAAFCGVIHGNNAMSVNDLPLEPSQAAIILIKDGNEGWRFYVAYIFLTIFCALHWVVQKFGGGIIMPPVIDEGHDLRARPEWRADPNDELTKALEAKKAEIVASSGQQDSKVAAPKAAQEEFV